MNNTFRTDTIDLLTRLLEGNMLSHKGDEMVQEFLSKHLKPVNPGMNLATCPNCGCFIFTADGKICVQCKQPVSLDFSPSKA